jgi:hypothetical protein
VLGKRVIETKTAGRITVREENAAGALEVMSRFAIDPRWLLYLPPTMAPCATSAQPGLLEHPAEAFAAYAADGIAEVICEEKHMGSRAIVLACRDDPPARPGARGLAQPGIKVRGPDYLRIIYGPDYALPANLARLQDRNLGRKRSLAVREYALGLEALDRVVSGEPLWRVHEAVFGVLALESEPVDPRL